MLILSVLKEHIKGILSTGLLSCEVKGFFRTLVHLFPGPPAVTLCGHGASRPRTASVVSQSHRPLHGLRLLWRTIRHHSMYLSLRRGRLDVCFFSA